MLLLQNRQMQTIGKVTDSCWCRNGINLTMQLQELDTLSDLNNNLQFSVTIISVFV